MKENNVLTTRMPKHWLHNAALLGMGLAVLGLPQISCAERAVHREAPHAARQATETTVPAELKTFLKRATTAANSRRPADFAPLTDADTKTLFAWAMSRVSVWEGDVLEVPAGEKSRADAPTYLAVFHAWHTCESDGDHVHLLTKTPQGWKLGKEIEETETLGIRIRDHDLRARIFPTEQSAAITDTVQVEDTEENAPEFGLLRLSQDFRVTTLTLGAPNAPKVAFRQVGGVIAFVPPAEKTYRLYLKYAGKVVHRGSDYITAREATLSSYWYPHTARLPATATVTATVPAGWTPIAIGERVREARAADGSVTITYRNEFPVSFFTLDAGRYSITTRTAQGKTLTVYLLTPNTALANQCLNLLASGLSFYDAHFGSFPYTRYGIVETQGPFTGAMEAYSFATFGPRTLPSTIPHELAHTWWGGMVGCTYTRSMWDESFAEYSDSLLQRFLGKPALQNRIGPDEAPRHPHRFTNVFDTVSMAQAYDTSDNAHSAVGYGKGALVLRVLEDEIGKETMLRCLTTFFAAYAKKGEPVEWGQFEAVVERVAGKDYHWFFAQWTERRGLPKLKLANVKTQRAEDGQGTVVEGAIVQEGRPYRLRVPVLLELRDGSEVLETVTTGETQTPFRLRVNAPPERLILDPDSLLPLAAPSPSAANPIVHDFGRE